ncbi:MAG: acyl-CoA thioesterase [Myxococcota bacterium]|jgi:acyl-CoA thioesterase
MSNFDDAIRWSPDGTLVTDEAWGQGRTTFGGLTAAAALNLLRTVEPARKPRTVVTTFSGPTDHGTLYGSAAVVRRGRSMTVARAEITLDGAPCLQMTGFFGDDRESAVSVSGPPRPDIAPPESLHSMPHLNGVMPNFLNHMDIRWTAGTPPFSSSPNSSFSGWCRHKTAASRGPEAALGLADAWPAPVIQMLSAPASASSVSWTMHFIDVPERTPDGWWWLESETVAAAHGYASTTAKLYQPNGALACWSDQLVAIYG